MKPERLSPEPDGVAMGAIIAAGYIIRLNPWEESGRFLIYKDNDYCVLGDNLAQIVEDMHEHLFGTGD